MVTIIIITIIITIGGSSMQKVLATGLFRLQT
jgi:hypothetical protein